MISARKTAFEVLQRWEDSSTYAEELIAQKADGGKLSPADRGFTNALVLGVLRNLSLLDHWIDTMRSRGKIDRDVRQALRLGLFQILCMRVPDHAAVNETVGLVRKHARPIVNAILRRAAREQEPLLAEVESLPAEIRFSIPDFLIDKWRAQFGREATDTLCKWSNQPAEIIIRANLLHPEAAETIAASDAAEAIPGADHFYKVEQVPIDWIAQGLVYVQDPATALAPKLLAPQPGQRILDACAAPGGKTALLAELMGNQGTIVATDRAEKRCKILRENLQRMKVEIADVAVADWGPDAPDFEPFDGILLDVPCSNTGVLRRRVDVRWRLYEGFTKHACKQQLAILEATAPLVKPGGVIVYSTCSIEPEENAELIDQFLQAHPDFKLEEQATSLPHHDSCDGAFAARLRKLTA
ncbi:MAG: 16S rRNA (cytosine967-C5)-methyltransferase [Verrucomicrobiales bacterium]|jgi:16S rRNA (cytosine967-C5)-methyltransferase